MEQSIKNSHLFKVYLWAISFLKPYKRPFFLVVLTSILIAGIELMIPKFIQYFIDVLVPTKNTSTFFLLMGCLMGLLVIMFYMSAVKNNLQRSVQEQAARDIHRSIFQHLRKLGFSYFEKHPVGEILSLMNSEVTALQDLYRRFLPFMIQEAVFSTIAILLMFSMNSKLALIIIPSFLLYYLIGPKFEKKASILSKELSTNRIKLNKKIYETISSTIEIRAFSAEDWEVDRLNKSVDQFNKSMIKAFLFAYLRGTVRRLSYYAGAIAILVYGSILVQSGSISVGEFSAFLLYYFTAMHRLTAVVTSLTEQRVLMFQVDKIYQFSKMEPTIQESDTPILLNQVKGEVNFQDVHFHYPEGAPLIRGFDLTVKAGEKVAFVGKSGNGKSTILKLLDRFYDPTQGAIYLDGVSLKDISISQLRTSIGFVFQETYLFGSTVRENILFGNPDASEEEMIQAAKAAYAHDFIMELEKGYDTLIGERGIKLSGGQKQRISIARIFLANPSIILLDEATSALDHVSEYEVKKALEKLLTGKTIFAVAHRLSTIQEYDMIVVIEDGQVAEKGSYDELMNRKGPFYQLSEGQSNRLEVTGVNQ